MEKLITRKTLFAGKEKDFSISQDFRILGVEKSVLDFIDEYADLNEDTTFIVCVGEEEKSRFTAKDFNNEKFDLSLNVARKKVVSIEITENLMKPQKQNEKDDAIIYVVNRLVKLVA